MVGFAAETEDVLNNAQDKLARKNLDLIVANDLTVEGAGFEVDTNVATIILKDGKAKKLDRMTKKELACVVIDEIVKLFKLEREE